MTPASHLPFLIVNASDLRRAIKILEKKKSTNLADKHYVMNRAKALGHFDLVPSYWYDTVKIKSTDSSNELERQFIEQSQRYGISTARLKTVYFRGVSEFHNKVLDVGSATMWGLVRVQKYINAVKQCDTALCDPEDADLLDTNAEEVVGVDTDESAGTDIFIDSTVIVNDVLYGTGSMISSVFKPGVVDTVELHESRLKVYGTLNLDKWTYELDLTTGQQNLSFKS